MKIVKKIVSILTAVAFVIGVMPIYAMQVVAADTQNYIIEDTVKIQPRPAYFLRESLMIT